MRFLQGRDLLLVVSSLLDYVHFTQTKKDTQKFEVDKTKSEKRWRLPLNKT